jgi:hypothetical protein
MQPRDRGIDGWRKLGVHQQRQARPGDVRQCALQVFAVDAGEAVAAGIDEEALEAGNAGQRQRLECGLVAVDAAAPECVVHQTLALRGVALGLERTDIGGLGQAVQRHVDDGGEAARGRGARGRGETLPFGAAWLVDVRVCIDEPGQQSEVA